MILQPDIKIFDTSDDLAVFFNAWLLKKIKETPLNSFLSLALSGGSTPKRIYRHIANSDTKNTDWEKLKIFWSDERCVPPDNLESNFKMAQQELLHALNIPEENIFRIFGEADPYFEAIRYSRIIETNIPVHKGIPRFDIILLGLGEDGHIASIFPDNMSLFNVPTYCEAVTHPQSGQKRITFTGKLINAAKNIIFLVTGKNKAGIVSKILQAGFSTHFPASLINPVEGELLWLLDSEAAELIR